MATETQDLQAFIQGAMPLLAPFLGAHFAGFGEALLRWAPAFPYEGEKKRAFVAVVSLLALACTLALNWAAGSLAKVDWAQAGAVVLEAALAVAAVVALHNGQAPGARRRDR